MDFYGNNFLILKFTYDLTVTVMNDDFLSEWNVSALLGIWGRIGNV